MKDSAGNAIAGLNLPPVWTDSGRRAALRLPEGVLADGADYRWTARTCTSVGCSPWSAQQTMTVREKPLPASPGAATLTLADDTLGQASAATDCTTMPCPTAPAGELRVGSFAGHQWATRFQADLSGLPKGARVTSATMSLTRSDCTADCAAQQPGVYELSSAWTLSRSGKELLDEAGTENYASDTALSEVDFGPLVQSWTERGENQGFALTVPPGAAGAAYHSLTAPDAPTRPRLTIRYLPPTAPGAVTDVVTVPGDSGLLATWNPPLDPGAAGELGYRVKVEKADGVVVAEQETGAPRAVFTELDNTVPYRVSVTVKNVVGDGPVTRSAPVQGASVPGGAAEYRDSVRDYLGARGKVLTGRSPSAADAVADAPHGQVFAGLLGAQERNLVDNRQALTDNGQSYGDASAEMTDVLVGRGDAADQVVVRATVTEATTLHSDGGDEPTKGSAAKRFTFVLRGDTAVLDSEADDVDAGQTLSATAAAQSQVETTSAEDSDDTADDPGSISLGENGFPDESPDPPGPTSFAARSVNGHGTANWAYNHTGIGWEYSQDCTNFVSKALYHGGGMKFRWGGRKTDGAWWQQYYLFGSVKNKSYTWSGADNLRRHFSGHRPASRVSRTYNAQLGDIVFFKWKKERRYNHAAVVTSKVQGHLGLSQHGIKNHTTLDDVLARYRGTSNPIQRVLIIRPRSAR
ncbi:amidase domain-containing protein [Streptomyces sp. NPDC088358]|uniref:amidase domain-containing protein n=1 Tax=Streptomyces sp. NPDC088358 TaxID=3365857 RepID=UPI0038309188